MSIFRKLAGETVLYGASNVLNRLLNFIIVTPYLTYVFAERQEEYGIHGLMYAFAALLMVVLTYGMETAYFRFGNRAENAGSAFSTALSSLLATTVFFVSLLTFFSERIANMLTHRPQDGFYVVLFAFIIGFDVLAAIPFARLRLENRPLRFAAIKAANILINASLLIGALELLPRLAEAGWSPAVQWYRPEYELTYVFAANLGASLLTLVLLLPDLLRGPAPTAPAEPPIMDAGEAPQRPAFYFDRQLWVRMLGYAWPLLIVGIAGMINQLADRFLLMEWLPGNYDQNLYQLGIYNACIKIAVLMNLFTQAFKYAAEPFFFRHADRSDARRIYARVAQAFTLVGSLAFLTILLYLDLVRYLINPNYWAGLSIVAFFLIAYLLLGLYYNFSVWYKLTDRTRYGAYIASGGALITLTANYFLIPRYGILGPAFSSLACFGFMCAAALLIGRKYYPVPYPVGRMAFYLLSAVAWHLVFRALEPRFPGALAPRMLVSTGFLAGYLGLLLGVERRQLAQVWRAIRRGS